MISSPVTAARRYHLFELQLVPLLMTLAMSSLQLEIQAGAQKLSPPKQTKQKNCKSGIRKATGSASQGAAKRAATERVQTPGTNHQGSQEISCMKKD